MSFFEKFSKLKRFNFDDIYNSFLSLDKRGQILSGIGFVLIILLILLLPASCVSSKLSSKEGEYNDYLNKASQVYGYLLQYSRLQKNFEKAGQDLSKSGKDALQTIVYNLAEEVGININRVSVKSYKSTPKENYEEITIEVSVSSVLLDEMLKLIDKLTHYDKLPLKLLKVVLNVDNREKNTLRKSDLVISTIRLSK